VTGLSLRKHLDEKGGYDPDAKRVWTSRGWMVPMTPVVPASGVCWGKSPDAGLWPDTRPPQSVSVCLWLVDHRPGDKQGCCAGNVSGGKVAGGKGEVEANTKGSLALLVNPYAATSRVHQSLLKPLELCYKAGDNKIRLLQMPRL